MPMATGEISLRLHNKISVLFTLLIASGVSSATTRGRQVETKSWPVLTLATFHSKRGMISVWRGLLKNFEQTINALMV
jgi:hypothetical protein